MSTLNRRRFLRRSSAAAWSAAAGLTVLRNPRSVWAAPANDRLTLGIIGCRGRGLMLAQGFAKRPDCRLTWFCDVDRKMYDTRAKGLAALQDGLLPQYASDFRKMLDDRQVDAVIIATPPHWHALATIWCCQAGKDVYCEKPQSHNCWEGRQAIEAARKYNRIVQIGLQNRSAPYLHAAKEYLDAGKLGKIELVRVFNQKGGEPNFPMPPDADPPAGFDWEMWNGPAPQHKYNEALRMKWRFFWRYSGGDMTYDGIHQIDIARWLCGVVAPRSVYSHGARYDTQGAAETPDTLVSILDFERLTMTFESTLNTPYMIKSDQGVRDGEIYPFWPQNTERVEIYGTQGVMYVGRMGSGWQVFVRQKDRQPVLREQMHGRFPDPEHFETFVQSVRNRQRSPADIEEGHKSTLLVHYAMISCRLGQKLLIDGATEQIRDNPAAMALFRREYRRPWVVPETV